MHYILFLFYINNTTISWIYHINFLTYLVIKLLGLFNFLLTMFISIDKTVSRFLSRVEKKHPLISTENKYLLHLSVDKLIHVFGSYINFLCYFILRFIKIHAFLPITTTAVFIVITMRISLTVVQTLITTVSDLILYFSSSLF